MLGALPPVFAGLDPVATQEASGYLQRITLEGGEVVMGEGDDDYTLAFVEQGAAQLSVSGVHIGSAGAHHMLGELELFGQMPRVATAVASGPIQLLVLEHDHYIELCNRGNPAAFNLERHAIRRIGERMRWLDDGITDRSLGIAYVLPDVRPRRGFLGGLFSRRPPTVDAIGVLRASPLFDWADPAVVAALANEFTVERFRAGQVLCRQGEVATAMYILADGRADVILQTSGRTAEMIATLSPGQACGESGMLQMTPRSSTTVARDDVVALRLERPYFDQLVAIDDAIGTTFRQGLLRNMIALLLATQRRFVEIELAGRPIEDTFRGSPVSTVWRD
ncbi:MAG: cyclic nucleotide-binding domain-containing protein [Myxococcota bacterium]